MKDLVPLSAFCVGMAFYQAHRRLPQSLTIAFIGV
jgi:hypothetical protein